MEIRNPNIQAKIRQLGATVVKSSGMTVLGVKYLCLKFEDGDELYVTNLGIPMLSIITPASVWKDQEYVAAHSARLAGTSTVYRIKPKNNPLGREVVLKWNRMGQDIPGETGMLFPTLFNSPFEEFSLVMELRLSRLARTGRLLPQKPLGIYIPHERVQPWQLGRKDYLMPSHEEVSIDTSRNYAVIYEWIKGLDLVEAMEAGHITQNTVEQATLEVDELLKEEGYAVADRKPKHIIVRPAASRGLKQSADGKTLMGIVDFELLKRTPDFDRMRRNRLRKDYLERQAHRFNVRVTIMPRHLHATEVFGVDYVYGKVQGTDAELWVVGRDPVLFEYFRPEKWRRTPRTKLSTINQTYHTLTKDDINVVWKVSKVGEVFPADPSSARNKEIVHFGYNSPFEEVALAQSMSREGLAVIYPRAIYMTGQRTGILDILSDDQRFQSHRNILTPMGEPVLRPDRDYISIWGYWNGLDQDLSEEDNVHLTPIGAFLAYHHKFITEEDYLAMLRLEEGKLREAGYEDLNFKGSHLLISLESNSRMLYDETGHLRVRVCNFECVRKIQSPG